MSFQPLVPTTGLAGWRFLQRTMPVQAAAFAKTPETQRDTAYFEAQIGKIDSAEQLVGDRRLLRVALGAFGLSDDINNRAFIQKIMEGGVLKPDSLANKMADDRYKKLTKAFGFGDFPIPNTKLSDFGVKISERFRSQQFAVAVGLQDDAMRLALNVQSDLPEIADSSASDDTKWFKILGTPPLRAVFETALGLPAAFGKLDIDQQLGIFRDKSKQQLDVTAVADFSDAEVRDKLIDRYLLRAQVGTFRAANSPLVALTLLQSMPRLVP